MHEAFKRGGKQAINKVMKNNPAMFLKLLALLVPRELQVEHSGGVKAMTDEQIERGIEVIKQILAGREAGAIFVLPPNVYVAPRRGDFLVSKFHPGPIPGNLVGNDF